MEIVMKPLSARTRICSRAISALLVALCIALAPAGVAVAEDQSLEYAVKAAFLYKFGLFVQWPGTAFSSPSAPLNLCVAGEDPFGAMLDRAVSDQKIDGRAIVIRRLKSITRDAGCHILYLGDPRTARSSQLFDTVRGNSVLTVSDERVPGTGAGIIHFVIKDNRVRFNIDDEAAAQNGLAISSKLMSLALDVKRRIPKEPAK
jgi:hypothetical protein